MQEFSNYMNTRKENSKIMKRKQKIKNIKEKTENQET